MKAPSFSFYPHFTGILVNKVNNPLNKKINSSVIDVAGGQLKNKSVHLKLSPNMNFAINI